MREVLVAVESHNLHPFVMVVCLQMWLNSKDDPIVPLGDTGRNRWPTTSLLLNRCGMIGS